MAVRGLNEKVLACHEENKERIEVHGLRIEVKSSKLSSKMIFNSSKSND
jgi:hypothetical protein